MQYTNSGCPLFAWLTVFSKLSLLCIFESMFRTFSLDLLTIISYSSWPSLHLVSGQYNPNSPAMEGPLDQHRASDWHLNWRSLIQRLGSLLYSLVYEVVGGEVDSYQIRRSVSGWTKCHLAKRPNDLGGSTVLLRILQNSKLLKSLFSLFCCKLTQK